MQMLRGDQHRLLGDRSRRRASVCLASAFAAASAYAPPDPIAMIPSSGSIRSPVPERRYVALRVHDDQHRLEPAQHPVGPPVLGQLDGGALEVAAVLLQLRLEAREEREGVGRRAGEAGQDLVVVQPADLLRALLDDGVAEGDLAVAGHDRLAAVPDRQNCCGVKHVGKLRSDPESYQRPPSTRGRGGRRVRPHLDDALFRQVTAAGTV